MNDTTTGRFQVKPNYFSSVEECLNSERKTINTNPRYKFFNQTHFTAGDVEQFQLYRDQTNGDDDNAKIDNVFSSCLIPDWDKYKQLHPMSVDNTFNYIFHKFKKGIFVKVKNGQLSVFLPFSKKNFVNEWHSRIAIDPAYKDLFQFIQHVQKMEGYSFNPKAINRFADSWYANNSLVRYEFPIHEGDTNIPVTADMFLTLCKERKVPNLEFFVNRRDFPILKTNETEAYDHLFGDNHKLISHNYDKYAPVLSMVGADNFADIPIPTGEDWARVCRRENKFFSRTCTRNYDLVFTPWEEKKSIAVFRGASTGVGTTIQTNPRLKLVSLSKEGLLDAGITEWNLRPRKNKDSKYLQTIEIHTLPFGLTPPLSPFEQAKYKYVVNVDGHVSAYRLSLELELGFCVLLVQSKYRLWYSHLLQPYIHYVPVKSDLSDLYSQIEWCQEHDKECKQISENAKEFAQRYLSKEGILDYLQQLLIDLKAITGIYRYSISPKEIQKEGEKILPSDYPKIGKQIKDLIQFPKGRSYDYLRGVEWVVRQAMNEKYDFVSNNVVFENNATKIYKTNLGNLTMIKKTYTEGSGDHANIYHEAYTAISEINRLIQYIPNFVYTFGLYTDDKGSHLLSEYISGMTLYEYIHSDEFDMKDFIFLLYQLALTLHVSQKACGFVHYDLTPWNCIVHKLEQPTEFDYVIDKGTVYRIKTQFIPVMLDYTRSHVIHDRLHHGINDMFNVSTIQDLLTVLNVSIYEIAKSELNKQDCHDLIVLSNFLSGTEYRRKPFISSGKNGLGDIRYFFGKAKKYSELVTCEKYDLEYKTPLQFIHYIQTHFPYKFCVQKTNNLNLSMRYGDSRQVFEYAFSQTPEKRVMTFMNVLERIKELKSVDSYYQIQELYHKLKTTACEASKFISESKKVNEFWKCIAGDMKAKESLALDNLQSLFKHYKPSKILFSFPTEEHVKYKEHIFCFPEKVKDMLESYKNVDCTFDSMNWLCETEMAILGNIFRPNIDCPIVHRPNTFIADVNTLRYYDKELIGPSTP